MPRFATGRNARYGSATEINSCRQGFPGCANSGLMHRSKKSSGAVFTGALLLLAGFVLSAAPLRLLRKRLSAFLLPGLLPATLILVNNPVRISHFKF
jgi:hypothetical protein